MHLTTFASTCIDTIQMINKTLLHYIYYQWDMMVILVLTYNICMMLKW